MAVTAEELGRRIAKARTDLGLTQSELGQQVEIEQSHLSRIEAGQRSVSTVQLALLADALKVTTADLLDERPLTSVLRVAARSTSGADDAAAAAQDRAVRIARVHRMLTDDELGVPTVQPPRCQIRGRLAIEQGAHLAADVRATLGLENEPLSDDDLIALAENIFGVSVFIEQFGRGVDGLYFSDTNFAAALINSNGPGNRQRFTLAHELCHHLCGDTTDGIHLDLDLAARSRQPDEMRANVFATNLLLPPAAVAATPSTVDDAVRVAHRFGVSMITTGWQLRNHTGMPSTVTDALINSSGDARRLAVNAGVANAFDADQALRYRTRYSPRFVDQVRVARQQRLLGVNPIADLFDIDPDRVDDWLTPDEDLASNFDWTDHPS